MIEVKTVYLSLGSNIGDREANLRQGIALLSATRLTIKRISSVYETDPVDVKNQPRFLNLVLEVQTEMFPMQLLTQTQRIEKELGRQRKIDKGPRTLDIDILLYASSIIDSPKLVIPHLHMHERRFVLEPMVELAPALRHPVLKRTMTELRANTGGQGLRKTDIKIENATA